MTELRRDPIDITHATLSVFFLTALAVATFWVLSPFLTAILWAVIVCVTVWPLLLRIEAAFGGRRRLAVIAVTAMILLVVFIPVTLALITVVNNAQNITSVVRSFQFITLPPIPGWIADVPLFGDRLAETWTTFAALTPEQRVEALSPRVQSALQWFAARAGSVGMMLLQFLLTTIISALVLMSGEVVRDGILRFATRLAGQHGYDAALLAGKTIRSVVIGVVGTALVQAAVAGAGLLVAGVPAAGLLTAVMLFLCLAQLGPMLVMLPAVVWLLWSNEAGWGSLLMVIAVVAGLLDGFLRPLLIKRGANVPLVLIFAGVLGGLLAFGVIGLFIGPVVLTVAFTLLGIWVRAGNAAAVQSPR